ncbi:MAG: hypothetical protein OEX11_05685, partial [Nitrosomonas sp.]|nr:hypothetical protein [Nitrosomonas sp.]
GHIVVFRRKKSRPGTALITSMGRRLPNNIHNYLLINIKVVLLKPCYPECYPIKKFVEKI